MPVHPIRKRGRTWELLSRSGCVLGRHRTYREALAQLRAVERSMHEHNPPERHRCECEHIEHFEGAHHPYGEVRDDVEEVETDYGKFHVCAECQSDHFEDDPAEEYDDDEDEDEK